MSERPQPVARWTPPAPAAQNTPQFSRRPALEGGSPVPLQDVAPSKWTRQSTAAAVQTTDAPFALPTEPEPSPWWEIDLGKSLAVESLTVWLEPIDPAARVRVSAYAIANPAGDPPIGCFSTEIAAEDLLFAPDESHVLSMPAELVARFIRIELVSRGQPVSLAIRGIQVLATELFAETLVETYKRAFALFADRPLFSARPAPGEGPFAISHRYRDVWDAARRVADALARRLETSTEPGARVFLGLCTKNRAEWFIAEVAAVLRGYVVVPLSPDDSEERLFAILARCPVNAVVCEAAVAPALARIAADHPSLRLLVVIGDTPPAAGPSIAFDALLTENAPPPPPARERSEDDLHTLLFTSGSTGVPKGAMRSYRKFNAMLASYGVAQPAVHLSFQPLCHLSERHYLPAVVMNGAHVGWSSGGAHLLSDLAALEPTWVASVPRLFDVVYAGYQRKLAAARAADPERDPAEIEAFVLRAHREVFGRRVQGVSTGSAPVSPEVLAFLRRCFSDLWVMDGYGSTEVGTIASDQRVVANVEVKLVPASDSSEARAGEPERGEIWVRSPHIIDGYFGDPEASAKSLDRDGFFRTGDLGERTADGGVRVIGRLSSTVKLGQGEFVTVDRIEADLSSSPVVDQIFIHPDAAASSLLAVVVPNAAAVARELGQPDLSIAEVAAHADAPRIVLSALRARGREAGLAGHELPRAVLLDPEPMTVASGLLTASGKLARRAAIERYEERLHALGATLAPATAAAPPPLNAASSASPAAGGLAARLAAIASAIVRRDVRPDEPLGDGIGLDSLTAAEVLTAIGEELGWTVPLAWWFEASTLSDLARLIERRPGTSTDPDTLLPARDLELVAAADPEARPPRARIERVLLTGVTGLLGAHLLEDLVLGNASGAHVVCLVRAPDDAAAAERVRSTLAKYRIPPLDPTRWSAIASDLGASRLGLGAPTKWAELAEEIDAVVHAGASVNWVSVYKKLREPNVLGTLSLLELAMARRQKPFHYISTISTAPADGDETTSLSFEQALQGSAYGLTKWIAEQHARRAGNAGHPVSIHRPGMITGHSARGLGNPDDYVHRYLRACVRYNLYLDRPERLDMTPVDYVSRAIVATLFHASSSGGGGVHHLCNVDQSMSYAELGSALNLAGAPCSPADYATFRAVAVQPKDSPLRPLASYFPESAFGLGSGLWPSAATRARLAALSVVCPPVDPPLVARYLAGLLNLP